MKKMHKSGIFYPIFKLISSSITPFLFMLLISPQILENRKILIFLFLIIFIVLIYGYISWKMFSYEIQKDKILISTNIIVKNKQIILPYKIQNYTYTSWIPMQGECLFNLYIQLEGNQEGSVISFIGIGSDELEKIKTIFNKKENIDISKKTPVSKDSLLFIICQSIISSSILILISNIFDIITEIEPEYFSIHELLEVIKPSNSILLYFLILTFIIILKNIIKFGSFSILIDNETIDIYSGIIFTKHSRILRKNIKGLLIKESFLQRFFSRSSIFLESCDRNEKQILFHPFVMNIELPHIVEKLYGEDLIGFSEELNSQGRKKQIIFQKIVILVAGGLILNYFQMKILYLIYFLIVLAVVYSLFKYMTKKFKQTDKFFIYINGSFNKNTQIISKDTFNKLSIKKPIYLKRYSHIRINYFNNSKKKKIRLQSVKIETLLGVKS